MEHREHHDDDDAAGVTAAFPTDTAGLPQAVPTELVELGDGDDFELRIASVAKWIGSDNRADGGLQPLGSRPDVACSASVPEPVAHVVVQGLGSSLTP